LEGSSNRRSPLFAVRTIVSLENVPPTEAPKIVHHDRYAYSAIPGRPAYAWPGGRRLAVYVGLNLEAFAFGEGLGAELAPGGPQPDVLNYAWRDYGNRVGAWRILDLLTQPDWPAGVLVNSALFDVCPDLVAAFAGRGDEIIAHGVTNAERQGVLGEIEEAALIETATATIARHTGRRPEGWLGPWISQSRSTPDLLAAAGYRYMLDWDCDDQPIWMKTRAGPILAMPYPQEINDIPAIIARKAGAAEFADMIVDQFDEMLAQSEDQPLVMGIALHPYIVGRPFRLRHLRRAFTHIAGRAHEGCWLTTPGAIAAHVEGLGELIPGWTPPG
jgi:peptidoglycan/xylan/chitin deacetylase (PgdA/CDA1 family)